MADALPVSPLAPKSTPKLPPLAGVRLAAVEAGIKYAGRKDLCAIVFDAPVAVAGVFTTSRCASAPVDWCRDLLAKPETLAQAVIINAGNANAFTGAKGAEAAEMTAKAASATFGVTSESVYLASTGVIGETLDSSGFQAHLESMDLAENNWADAASAIMTTDTYPKLATQNVELDGERVTINGIAKGSGMIAPDMATMLAFVVTDADIAPDLLQEALSGVNAKTFNAITVDSDTSTSDTALLFATGKSGPRITNRNDDNFAAFKSALHTVFHDLAQQIVRDGEGATKLVQIDVRGAVDDASANAIARSIANSPLVKTAIAGEDANWGRVVMAVGKAGEPADRDLLCIRFGDVQVARNGERDPDYCEQAASQVMREDEINLTVEIGLGDGEATVWTCDLTKQYVAINGDYRS